MASGDLHGVTAKHFDHYEVEEMDPPWPQVMEFSLSNTCNLECIMCNGASSSLIRSRREKLPPLPRVYGNDFFRDLRPFLPHLKTAKFLGGEPFLIPEVHRIWDFMIEDKLTTDCVVTTNGTRYDAKVERVLERLPMSIIFSMDGATKAALERIRVNAKFDALVDHAKRFIHYTRERGTKFRFIYSLMQQNWHELGDFLLFAEALGVEVNLSPVVHPAECSLYALPGEELHTIVKQLEARRASVARQLQLNRETWTNAIDTIAANVFANKGELGVPYTPLIHIQAEALEAKGELAQAIETALGASPNDAPEPASDHMII